MEREVIRVIAYRIYEKRLRNNWPGDALSDWLEAEREYDLACHPWKPREAIYGRDNETPFHRC